MSKKEKNQQQHSSANFVFGRQNYIWMFIGLAFIALGYILMSGGGSSNPEVFNPDIFSFRRIRLAPFLVLAGLGIQIYAILRSPEKREKSS
jgi:hypothetical protein